MLLNLCASEEVMAGFLGVDEETFAVRSCEMVKVIARLKPFIVSLLRVSSDLLLLCWFANPLAVFVRMQIKWENRHRCDTGKKAKVSVDGTDFRLPQQHPKKRCFSHKAKMKCSGCRCKVAVCIQTGDIVWINGPFPCGAFPDITIFRRGLKQKLLQAREKAQADLGHRGEPNTVIIPNDFDSDATKKLKADVRARHETVNKRFKQFECLNRLFRHDINKHQDFFTAVAVVAQIAITNGEELCQVQCGNLPLEQWRARRNVTWNGSHWV